MLLVGVPKGVGGIRRQGAAAVGFEKHIFDIFVEK